MIGKKFGKLTILGDDGKCCDCLCDCGSRKRIFRQNIKIGKTKSCGKDCSLKKVQNLSGQKFGKLLVLQKLPSADRKKYFYRCLCDCGKYCSTRSDALTSGKNTGCGCLTGKTKRPASVKIDLTGKRFGKIYVAGIVDGIKGDKRWIGVCECGTIKIMRGSALNKGRARSCGCSSIESLKKRCGEKSPLYKNGNYAIRGFYDRNSKDNILWKKAVKARDGQRCQLCGNIEKDKKNITAHHLNSYLNFPNQRLDINNGITLCRKCHQNFHAAYGTLTDKGQFYEYVLLLDKDGDLVGPIKKRISLIELEYLENIL